jgi:hypothetical protein
MAGLAPHPGSTSLGYRVLGLVPCVGDVELDAGVLEGVDGLVPADEVPDAEVPDAEVPDVEVPDVEVPAPAGDVWEPVGAMMTGVGIGTGGAGGAGAGAGGGAGAAAWKREPA